MENNLPERLTINGVVYVRSDVAEQTECAAQSCTYFTHYLVHYDSTRNGEKLEHVPYHAAEKKCEEAQNRVTEWLERHSDDDGRTPMPEFLERQASHWEKRVCA